MIQIATDADFGQILESNSKVIVKYYADWCGSCKLFSPKFKRLSNDENYSDIVFLDVNAEENEEARKLAGVNNLPFFAIFQDGQLVEGISASLEERVVELLVKLK
jgi:thioredoxin 1